MPEDMRMTSYCDYCNTHPDDTFNRNYHDREYGFPLAKDNLLFERLMLEINQAGLSWITILKKKDNFHCAYNGFDVDIVAGYSDKDRARLLSDAGIIRNRLKVNAAIENARRIQALRPEYGSFNGWLRHWHRAIGVEHGQTNAAKLEAHLLLLLDEWSRLFKKTFLFTGGEIVREFLVSTGYLPGAHDKDCPIYTVVKKKNPPWMKSS
jgi:DNA-3-methyladenine glycosylase I